MKIDINVSDVSLDSKIGEDVRFDEDGEPYGSNEVPLAELVVRAVVRDNAQRLAKMVDQVNTDLLREHLLPIITEQLASVQIRRTDRYGESLGASVSLPQFVTEVVTEVLTQPALDKRGGFSDRPRLTLAQQIVKDEVTRQIRDDLAEIVGAEREKFRAAVRSVTSAALAAEVEEAASK